MDITEIIRVGTVSSVSGVYARVTFNDKNKTVSGDLRAVDSRPSVDVLEKNITPTINNASVTYNNETKDHTHEADEHTHDHEVKIGQFIPNIGDQVLCIFLPQGGGDGFIIGRV